MLGRIWGQTRNSDDRAFDPPELPKRWSDSSSRLERPDMGTDTMSDLNMGTDTASGIPIGNVQRATFNSQLSTG